MTKPFSALKKIIPTACLGLLLSACQLHAGSTHDNSHGHAAHTDIEMHIGPITPEQLLSRYPIFAEHKASDETAPSDAEVTAMANQLHNKKMVVVFGTWCHDSQREIPRLLNLLERVNAQHSEIDYDIQFIASAPTETRDPELVEKYKIRAVPTIMLFDKEQELGRVVEVTKINLAADIANMRL